jgi:2-haloacid dehalogenase
MREFNQFEIVSFDCYGTLIDWEREILPALKPLLLNGEIDFSDLFTDTAQHIKVEFDWLITAEKVRSYKPSTRNFEIALETMGIPCEKLLHFAQSVYHDIVPAASMGISTVWVNRRHDKTGVGATLPASGQPDLEVPNLKTLVEVIG